MDYNLNIVTSVKGQASIDSALKSIAKVRSLAADIKPISLTTSKSGKLHDEIRIAKTELDKFSRKITNTLQRGESTAADFSSTLSGVVGQARAFATALDNISLKSGKAFEEQSAEVQNYARTLAEAEKKATELAFTQNQIIRSARQQAGAAIGPVSQLGSPEALAQQVRFESAQIEKGNRLRKEQARIVERINDLAANKVKTSQFDSQIAKINLALDQRQVDAAEQMTEELKDQIRQNERIINQNKKKKKGAEEEGAASKKITASKRAGNILQGALLGGGFPLLFGGPSFSAVGGLAGGAIGGGIGPTGRPSFAGGIAGSALLTPLDAAVKAAVELGKALEDPTKNAQQLIDLLPLSGTKTKGLIRELQDLGLNSTASAVAVETLGEEIGDFGIKDIEKFKEKNDAFANEVKKLRLALAALASNKLIGFITFLTQAVNLFNRGGGVSQGGGMLGRAAGFAQAQGEMADEGALGGTGTLPAKPDKPLPTKQQIKLAERTKEIRKAEIMLAGLEVKIEQDRFGLIRGQFEVEQSKIALGRANIKLAKADLELAKAQTDADKKRLGLKQALAEAAFLEAKAAKENAETLARQQQASAELGIRQFLQGIQLNEMQQRIGTDRQVRSTSPFAREGFLTDPFFGKSSELQNEQALRYTETLRMLNKQITENNINIQMGQDLSNAEKEALVRKGILLERELKLHQELTPARDEAALAQVRFAEAMALTVPVTDSLFDSLLAVVEGTKTAEQAFADFLRSIASMLMDAAKQMIATYIAIGIARMFAGIQAPQSSGPPAGKYGTIPSLAPSLGGGTLSDPKGLFTPPTLISGKARGGAVGAGRPYMVGERGPELFVPGAQGNIVPNNAMGGSNIVVNVDASGSSVEGDSDQAAQLGKMLGAAVQAELVKQTRPGGLLAS